MAETNAGALITKIRAWLFSRLGVGLCHRPRTRSAQVQLTAALICRAPYQYMSISGREIRSVFDLDAVA